MRSFRSILLLLVLCQFLCTYEAGAQVLADDFDRPDSDIVGNGWAEYETTPGTGASIAGGQLALWSTTAGRDYVSKATPGEYETVLSDNSCKLEWSFNMRQLATSPTGFNPGNRGLAVVLAASHPDLLQGQGYAVVIGAPTTAKPLRLVRYSNGLSSNAVITPIISHGDVTNQFVSVRVTYEPLTATWEMFYTTHGSIYIDPTTVSASAGTGVDATYAGQALPYIGALWNHTTVYSIRGLVDNLMVPFDCSSRVFFSSTSGSVNSFAGGYSLPLQLINPHMSQPTQVTVELSSGDAAIVDGFSSGMVTFGPGQTSATLELNIPLNGACIGHRTLVFDITDITGGSGTPFIDQDSQYTLSVVDDRSSQRVLLNESFETDGNGSRYTLNAPHATPSSGTYFLRGTNSDLVAAGGLSLTNIAGSHCMGVSNLTGIAPDAEAVVTFTGLDIAGVGGINISMRAGARRAARYDQSVAQRDHLMVEVNVDGTGWMPVGSFRSHKQFPLVDGWFMQDMDLDGVGDGPVVLDQMLRQFNFTANVTGWTMDVRIRARTTSLEEEIYFDDMRVQGVLCRPLYYSTGGGSESDAIWSHTLNGVPEAISVDRNTTLVVRNGHTVTSSGASIHVDELIVEEGGALHLNNATWQIRGSRVTNDGTITSTTGGLRILGNNAVTMDGAGNYDLFDLSISTLSVVDLHNAVDIRGSLRVESGVLDATGANVRLRSTAAGTGRLAALPPGSSYLGELTMERYIPAGATNWRFLGSPVAGTTVQDWQDDFFTAGYPGSQYPNFYSPPGSGIFWPSVRWYDETVPGAAQMDGLLGVTSTQPLLPGQGFAAWCGTSLNTTAAFTIDVKGVPNIAQTPITLPMSYTDSGNPSVDGYNLVSNPLPSAIAFSQIARGANVGAFYWVFNPANGNNATWNGIVGTNGANGTIQSSQAFWLKANGPAVTTTIAESAKVNSNSGGLFGSQINDLPILRIKVSDAQFAFTDEAVIVFAEGTPGVDQLDVPKLIFPRQGPPAIASEDTEGTGLAINMFGMPGSAVSIPLQVQITASGTHVIEVSDIDIIAGLSCVKLEDLQENVIIPLNSGATYQFEMEASEEVSQRFILHLSAPVDRVIENVTCHGMANGSVTATIPDGEATIRLMDAFSGMLQEQMGHMVTFNELAAGNYMLSIGSDAGCGDLTGAFTIAQPLPLEVEITAADATCGMADGLLEAEVLGGRAPYSMAWSNGDTNGQIMAQAGQYMLTVTDANDCVHIVPQVHIEQSEPPVAAFVVQQPDHLPGEVVSFSNMSMNAGSYIWEMGDGAMFEAANVSYTYGLPGTYHVTLTAINGACEDVVTQQVVIGGATGMQENNSANMVLWHDGTNINIRHGSGHMGSMRVELLDATGRLHGIFNAPAGGDMVQVPASGMNSGIWFVRIGHDGEQYIGKVVIAR